MIVFLGYLIYAKIKLREFELAKIREFQLARLDEKSESSDGAREALNEAREAFTTAVTDAQAAAEGFQG